MIVTGGMAGAPGGGAGGNGATTPYSYLELPHLFERLGDTKMKDEYYNKFIANGGKIINIS